MKKIIIFAILPSLIITVIYIDERNFFSNNVAGFAYSKVKPEADLNNAIALINKALNLERNTWHDAADLRIQLENGALVNNKSDRYHMFCYSFFKDTSEPCKSAYGKIYLTYIKEKGINYYKITEINYIYSFTPLFGYRIRIQYTSPGNNKKYLFEKKMRRCSLLRM
jgi:hypothetical protein